MSEQEQQITDFIETRDSEEAQLTTDFAIEFLRIELEIKSMRDSQKEIKADAKSNGIAIKQVTAAINKLKKMASANPLETEEEDFLVEKFQENVDISVLISDLTAKD